MNKILKQLLNPSKKIAGLDIGTSTVKFMEIEGDSLEDCRIVNYAIETIPPNYVSSDGKFTNIEGMAEVIKKCYRKSGSSVKNVAIALQTSGVIYKEAMIPNFDNEEDLNMQVENEIVKYFPDGMSLDEVTIDFYSIGPNEQNPVDNDTILIAAKKQSIEEKMAIVELAGLVPVIMDVEHYALQNMLRIMLKEDFNSKTVMLLDCSANIMRILAFKNGKLIYIKDTEIGGNELSKSISSNMGINNQDEIEKLKTERSENQNATYSIIEKNFLVNYASEFLRAFQYFINITTVAQVDEIILTGGVANMDGIEEYFKNVIVENEEQHIKTYPYVARVSQLLSKSNKVSLTKLAKEDSGLFLVSSLALRQYLRQY